MDFPVTLVVSVAALVMILLLAGAARRLLGVRFGAIRTFLAGLLAFALSAPLLSPILDSFPRTPAGGEPVDPGIGAVWVLLLVAMCVVLIPMVLLVLAEALVPPGSIPGPLEVVRSMRGRISRARRYSQITRIAIRHGLGPYLRGRGARVEDRPGRRRLAASLRQALDDGGVTFVKLGQVLSTRRDLLPAEFVEELGLLQDRVQPAPWEQIEPVLTAELGGPPESVFAEFDRTPLAAASIAQVHAARLRTGESVVVKVRRPGIDRVVARDLDIVRRLAATLETRTRWGRSLGVRELAEGFAVALCEELDFRVEAANMAAVIASRASGAPPAVSVAAGGSGGVAVTYPGPVPSLCGERVLVMERLTGRPLAAADDGARGLERARALLDCLLRQVLVEGVFHADPHPGNLMLLDDGTLALLDFGSVGRLDAAVRSALQRFLLAMNRQDPVAVTDALLEVMPRPEDVDEPALERALGQFMARHLVPGSASVQMFTDLFRIVSGHGLSVPPEVAAVFRALATLEGTLQRLAPGFDLVGEARAFAGRHLSERLDAGAVKETVVQEVATLLPMLRRLPRRIERIASAAEHGRLGVNVRLLADDRDRRFLTGLLHQVLLTVLGATAGLMAAILLGLDGGPRVTPAISLFQLIGYNLLVISAILVLRVLIVVFRRPRDARP
ncbi:ABC1 kinase family protein [Nonomuraea rhodomycinica]|uniref:AarF/ABC1/UbiB kinase family protein n=1 Tax=Nonomuraea rhodomycinica TaxID=1712872 RepID=A0A7Y6IJA6_9ACTN|nr:AarF/UbiB family protein [Nonomuraea rhodomycinica]NUW39270.1 AarF/ABC1/UbiB kinase family protein [Nonomuraea rhodomycinica]